MVLWLAYLVTLCIGTALAYLVAAVSPTLAVANAALPSYVVTLLFFTGGLLNPLFDPDLYPGVCQGSAALLRYLTLHLPLAVANAALSPSS